jgi:hypothetical protein
MAVYVRYLYGLLVFLFVVLFLGTCEIGSLSGVYQKFN